MTGAWTPPPIAQQRSAKIAQLTAELDDALATLARVQAIADDPHAALVVERLRAALVPL